MDENIRKTETARSVIEHGAKGNKWTAKTATKTSDAERTRIKPVHEMETKHW